MHGLTSDTPQIGVMQAVRLGPSLACTSGTPRRIAANLKRAACSRTSIQGNPKSLYPGIPVCMHTACERFCLSAFPVLPMMSQPPVHEMVQVCQFDVKNLPASCCYNSASLRRGMMFMDCSSWNSSLHAYGILMVAMCSEDWVT